MKQMKKALRFSLATIALLLSLQGGLLLFSGSAQAALTNTTPNPCDKYADNLYNSGVLPLFPSYITGGEDTTEHGPGISKCSASMWNRVIFVALVYKSLALVNWIAGALAVILTILSGVYYVSGFASENNVKKAKTILGATYAGFAIVLCARLIVQGSFLLFSDNYKPIDPLANQVNSQK